MSKCNSKDQIMKYKSLQKQITGLLLLLTACFLLSGCEKKENDPPDMAPENWLDHSYAGTLKVEYTNSYPEWDVSTQMDVEIEKELGTVTISSTTLNYSGETLVSEDSKIERTGSWSINPNGELKGDIDHPDLFIDAGLITENDIQKIYAKDNSGNWIMVNETDFSGHTPYSELLFDMDDAIVDGSVVSVNTDNGSIIWTLCMVVELD